MTQHKPTPPAPLPPEPDVIAGAQAAGPLLEQALAQGQTVQQVFIRQLQQHPPRHEQHWYWLLCQLLALHATPEDAPLAGTSPDEGRFRAPAPAAAAR